MGVRMRKYVGIGGLSAIRHLGHPGGGEILSRFSRMFLEMADKVAGFRGLNSAYSDHDPQGDLAVGAITRDCLIAAAPSFDPGFRSTGLRRTDFEGGS